MEKGYEVYAVSAVTGEGVKELLYRAAARLKELPPPKAEAPVYIEPLAGEGEFQVIKEETGVFRLEGEQLLKRIARYDLNQDEALHRLQKYLRRRGVEEALKKAGVKDGDLVRAGEVEFIYCDEDE
ncbi:MAG: Obg family GTPase CgtA [Clostridia bacterium]|nr:Obg family GTPase CgtA [Clostridia bacterium]